MNSMGYFARATVRSMPFYRTPTTCAHIRLSPVNLRLGSRPVSSSSSPTATTAALPESLTAASQIEITDNLLQHIQRHGRGDAVITLNVGGKEFHTLRSTVAACAVLAEHVSRAEANDEFTHGGKAVFVDRDPTHFHLILGHLRNKVEGLSYYKAKHKAKANHVQLPKDITALRDIYVEATHYGIRELQADSCQQNLMVNIMGVITGGSNPFDTTAKMIQQLRRGLVTIGGMGTLAIGSQQDHSKLLSNAFPSWFPEVSKEEEEKKTQEQPQLAA